MKYYIKDISLEMYFKGFGKGLTPNINKAHIHSLSEGEIEYYNEITKYTLIPANPKKILIIGDARHGKDTFADMIYEEYDYKATSSSMAALNIFLFDILKTKYNLSYSTKEEAFEDRVNHRSKWFDEISLYNKDDKSRLAKEILKTNNIYVGMRSDAEISQCKKDGVFDLVIGVINYRKEKESEKSNDLNLFLSSDFIVTNNGTLEDLKQKVIDLKSILT